MAAGQVGNAYVMTLASSLGDSNKELADIYTNLARMEKEMLWHQLTEELERLVKKAPGLVRFESLVELYTEFVSGFSDKLNPIRIVSITSAIARGLEDNKAGFEFLQNSIGKEQKKFHTHTEASVYAGCELGVFCLEFDQEAEAKSAMKRAEKLVSGRSQLSQDVYSSYYRLVAKYHKINGPPEEFYKNAMYYLAYTPLDSMPVDAQSALAFDLCLSALVGENVFSFGELIGHAVFKTLGETGNSWIGELLRAFNAGDIEKYDAVVNEHGDKLAAQPVLVRNKSILKQKISVLALMGLVITHENRVLSFEQIASATKLPVDEVELLVMKAFSKELVRGKIDEIEQTVSFSWVRPRALTVDQIGAMTNRVSEWSDKVQNTLQYLQ